MIQQNNRAVGYVRRSTDRQEQSIPDQKKAIEAYAAESGFKLSKFYVDDAISIRLATCGLVKRQKGTNLI